MIEELIQKLERQFPDSHANIYFFAIMVARNVESMSPFGLNRKERFAVLSVAKEILKVNELHEIEADMKEIIGFGTENAPPEDDETFS